MPCARWRTVPRELLYLFIAFPLSLAGFGLTIGLIPLALWLFGAAYSPELYQCISKLASSIIGKLFLFGWTLAYFYHLGNGIRHLNWDIGKGFKLDEVLTSGRAIGSKIGEDKFITNTGGGNGGVMTREQATARKKELMNDKAWSKSYLDGDAAKGREMTALNTIIVG